MRLGCVCSCFALLSAGVKLDAHRYSTPQSWAKVEELMTNYSADWPPWGWVGGPKSSTVQVGLEVIGVVVNTAASTAEVSCWFRMRWDDPRLRYNGSAFFGTEEWEPFSQRGCFSVPSDKVWKPDLVVTNSYKNPFEDFMDGTQVSVFEEGRHKGGNMYWSRPGKITVGCKFDMTNYPFDAQDCSIDVESWVYDANQLRLVPMPGSAELVRNDSVMFNDILITGVTFSSVLPSYPVASAAPWSKEVLTLKLQRHPGTYITYVISPMFLLVILASLASWLEIKPNGFDSDRLAYVATILLTAIATMLFFNEKRAMSGADCWLDYYQCACLSLIVIVLLESFLVVWLDRHPEVIQGVGVGVGECLRCLPCLSKCPCVPKKINIKRGEHDGKKAKKMVMQRLSKAYHDGDGDALGQAAVGLAALDKLQGKKGLESSSEAHSYRRAQDEDSEFDLASDNDDDYDDDKPLEVCIRPGQVLDMYFRNIYPFFVVIVIAVLWREVKNGIESNDIWRNMGWSDYTRSGNVMAVLIVSIMVVILCVACYFVLHRCCVCLYWSQHKMRHLDSDLDSDY